MESSSKDFDSELLNLLMDALEPQGIRFDVFCDSEDPNKIAAPVRITHLPSKTVVSCDKYPEHKQNKIIALLKLRNQLLSSSK